MYEKYLNKQAKILIRTQGTGLTEKEEGLITAFNDKFIELNNNRLINCFSILQIVLKED